MEEASFEEGERAPEVYHLPADPSIAPPPNPKNHQLGFFPTKPPLFLTEDVNILPTTSVE